MLTLLVSLLVATTPPQPITSHPAVALIGCKTHHYTTFAPSPDHITPRNSSSAGSR